MRLSSGVVAFFVLTGLSSACSAQIFDNPFSEYLERGITITPGAGKCEGCQCGHSYN